MDDRDEMLIRHLYEATTDGGFVRWHAVANGYLVHSYWEIPTDPRGYKSLKDVLIARDRDELREYILKTLGLDKP